MTSALTISVITPCWNSGPYLEKSLGSVFAQAGDFRIQLLVMDGDSTDGSQAILARLAESLRTGSQGGRCQGIDMAWKSEKDTGQSDALNKLLPQIQGDVVVWLNADDWFAPGAFAAVAEAFRADKDLQVLVGNCPLMRSESEPLEGAPARSFITDPATMSPFNGGQEWVLVTPEVFFRPSLLAQFHFDVALDYFMDVDLWMHLFLPRPKLLKLEQTLAFFRWHSDCKTVKAWKSFLPKLLVEDHTLFCRHRDRLRVAEAEQAFEKLILHFLTNWQRLGVLERNDKEVRQLVETCPALGPNDRKTFSQLYAAAMSTLLRTAQQHGRQGE